ncbi:ubiquinone biosynthesis accessory factor UbiJ [Legionella sp. CNM-4043-24]|uniref:ubiquinone biosynthesis accessory factor UbiJ n=1 Tax=Legionella sp. CNM-4043-24 TaxID=3421646 RepID=UPI00403AFD38
MLKKYSLKALEQALNFALALDEQSPDKINALQGKIVEMIISPLNVNFFIRFEDGQIRLLDSSPIEADTRIHSSPIGLIRLSFLPASQARSLFNDSVRISGNVVLGMKVKQLIDELDIDWEGHLAHFTGDVVAHQIGSLFRQGRAFQQRIRQSVHNNLSNYLQEETRLFPPREEVDDFFHDIDQTAMDVERLEAKINLLSATHETH